MHPRGKIVATLSVLAQICQECKCSDENIVLTSGCFDLLHGGHLEYICDAAEMGHLVVGINSDASVRKLKGEGRPVRDQYDRAFTMAGFSPVELVAIFDCDYELIRAVRPDIYVVSSTSHVLVWDDKERVKLLEGMGAKIVEIQSKKTDSTTDIIRRSAHV